MKIKLKLPKISADTALTLWHKNINLTKDLTGRINKVLALRLTHNDIEALKARSLTQDDIIKITV